MLCEKCHKRQAQWGNVCEECEKQQSLEERKAELYALTRRLWVSALLGMLEVVLWGVVMMVVVGRFAFSVGEWITLALMMACAVMYACEFIYWFSQNRRFRNGEWVQTARDLLASPKGMWKRRLASGDEPMLTVRRNPFPAYTNFRQTIHRLHHHRLMLELLAHPEEHDEP